MRLKTPLLKNAAALVVACLIGGGLAQYHFRAHFDPHIAWDGFNLPGFDAHVYVAMAEEPRVFTLSPWGYRILLPALIGAFAPPRLIVPAFEWAAQASLIVASGLLFVYLRLLGATLRSSLLAVLAMMATPSVSAVFENPFLVEPFALALLLLALIAIERDIPWAIALSLLLLSLSKEIWVVLLPIVFLKSLNDGARGAGLRTAMVAAPAAWIWLAIRFLWAPQSAGVRPSTDYLATLSSIITSFKDFAPDFLMGGLVVAALLGLSRPGAREYLKEHALTLLPLLVLPLFAAAYTGEGAATSFFKADVPRLLIYALPFVAALAVHLDPAHTKAVRPSLVRRWSRPAVVAGLIILGLSPRALDRYSRIDLSTTRDGPYVLGFVRETLKTARKLERGETLVFDPKNRTFAWGVSPPNELGKLRFFLRDGFGPRAHYGIHDVRIREARASIILPVRRPQRLRVTATMDARASAWVTFLAGGRKVGEALIGPQAVAVTLDIAADRLFRGDNPIELQCEEAATVAPRLLRLEIAPAKPGE